MNRPLRLAGPSVLHRWQPRARAGNSEQRRLGCIWNQGGPPFRSPPGEEGESCWPQGGPGWARRSGLALRQLLGGVPKSCLGAGEWAVTRAGSVGGQPPPTQGPLELGCVHELTHSWNSPVW